MWGRSSKQRRAAVRRGRVERLKQRLLSGDLVTGMAACQWGLEPELKRRGFVRARNADAWIRPVPTEAMERAFLARLDRVATWATDTIRALQ